MTVSPGFTAEEIREFVHEYYLQPHGQKGRWLASRDVSRSQLDRWRASVFDGDVDRGLVPRQGGEMTVPSSRRGAFEKRWASERDAHAVEVARLEARVAELEETNDALGKAIGLLHTMSEQEPEPNPEATDPSDSSSPKTPSSPN